MASLQCWFPLPAVLAWAQNEQIKAHALAAGLDAGKATNLAVSFPGKAQGLAGLGPQTRGGGPGWDLEVVLAQHAGQALLRADTASGSSGCFSLPFQLSLSPGVAAAHGDSFASVSKAVATPSAWAGLLRLVALAQCPFTHQTTRISFRSFLVHTLATASTRTCAGSAARPLRGAERAVSLRSKGAAPSP